MKISNAVAKGEKSMEDDGLLRNEKGQVSMMPLVHCMMDDFGEGIFAQLQFAPTPESLQTGELGVVQLAISAEQALKMAAGLKKYANRILERQGPLPTAKN
jgi:hypothetical protein